jgi:hypothetical protein
MVHLSFNYNNDLCILSQLVLRMNDIPAMEQYFASLSTDRLVYILNIRFSDYRSEAIDIAVAELRRRGVAVTETQFGPRVSSYESENPDYNFEGEGAIGDENDVDKIPPVAYVLAGVTGFVIPSVIYYSRSLIQSGRSPMLGILFLTLLAGAYALAGGVFGYLWPRITWRWGLWIVLPMLCLGILGNVIAFSRGSSPELLLFVLIAMMIPFLIALAIACLGGVVGARRKMAHSVSVISLLEHLEQ